MYYYNTKPTQKAWICVISPEEIAVVVPLGCLPLSTPISAADLDSRCI